MERAKKMVKIQCDQLDRLDIFYHQFICPEQTERKRGLIVLKTSEASVNQFLQKKT